LINLKAAITWSSKAKRRRVKLSSWPDHNKYGCGCG